jgi:hypothetical protein
VFVTIPVLRSGMKNAASRPGNENTTDSSLPGLTRQSILFEECFLRRVMDTRVKPAYDAEYVATSFSISDSHVKQPSARVLAAPREVSF